MWQCSGAIMPSGRQNWWLLRRMVGWSPVCGSPPHASSTASSQFPYLLSSRTFCMPSGKGRGLISWHLMWLFSGSVIFDPLWPHWLQHSRFPCLSLSSKFAQTYVVSVDRGIQPFHPLSPPSPPALNLSQIRVFSSELALRIRWPKYWSFRFSISPSNEYSALISFKIECFELFAVQGILKSLLQHHS